MFEECFKANETLEGETFCIKTGEKNRRGKWPLLSNNDSTPAGGEEILYFARGTSIGLSTKERGGLFKRTSAAKKGVSLAEEISLSEALSSSSRFLP